MFFKKPTGIVVLVAMFILFCGNRGCGHFWPVAAAVIGTAIVVDAVTPRYRYSQPYYQPPPACYATGEWRWDYYSNNYRWHTYQHPVPVPCQ